MASGPTVGENDGARERQRFMGSKVYTRKSFKGLKKNTAVEKPTTAVEKPTGAGETDKNITFTATTVSDITTAATENHIAATSNDLGFSAKNINQSNTNLLQQEPLEPEQGPRIQTLSAEDVDSAPEPEKEAQLQTLSAEDVNSAPEPEEEPKLQTLSAEDVNLTEQEQGLGTRDAEGVSLATEPETEHKLVTLDDAKDVDMVIEPEPEPEQQSQTLGAKDVNMVTEPELEQQLQTMAVDDVHLSPEKEPELHIPAAEDVDTTLAPGLEQQLQTMAVDEVLLSPEQGTELQPQSQAPAAEDVNATHAPGPEQELQTMAVDDVNLSLEQGPELQPQSQAPAAEDVNATHAPGPEQELQTMAVDDVNLSLEQGPELQPQLQIPGAEDDTTTPAPGPEQEPQLQTQAPEDVNPVQQQEQQQQLVSPLDATADDSCGLNRQLAPQEPGNGSAKQGLLEGRVNVNLGSGSGSRSESKQELRRKLEIELDRVRKLVKRIEAKEGEIGGGFSHSHVPANGVVNNGATGFHSEVASAGVHWETPRPLNRPSVSVLENGHGVMGDNVEKEKRTPKANPLYRNSEFLLAKDKFPPAESNKKPKLNGKKHGGSELGNGFGMGPKFFKSCSSLLDKLMKHKHGWVFNKPVDAEELGLHDYHIIIKHPMDLGTVKAKLNTNWYKSPKEFAEDVRLTFRNAMTYNPKGQDVHLMAELLEKIFEDRWAIIESDYNRQMRFHQDYEASLPTPTSRYAPLPMPMPLTRPAPLDMRRIVDRSESLSYSFDPRIKPTSTTPSSRTPAPKKPKAKDLNKRDMTYEEKQKLSTNLQSLPSEKLDNIVQIIRKRNSAVLQHDDEIEVDIDRVDAETLWELDRFVTNYKKGLSKHKRKAQLAIQARIGAEQNVQVKNQPLLVAAPPKESRTDERNVSASSPVQGAKEGDNVSGSSSSSSSSSDSGSSSSDSDSDSSSASGSDAEQSPRS